MFPYAKRPSVKSPAQCRNGVILLSVLWVLGLIFGLFFISSSDSTIVNSLYSASLIRPSFIGTLVVFLLPIAVTALAAFFASSFLIYLLCFFKALCYSLVLFGVVVTFGYSGWLIGFLFLFSGSCVSALMLWVWFRVFACNFANAYFDLLICSIISVLISLIDYFLVSPYLVMLLNY